MKNFKAIICFLIFLFSTSTKLILQKLKQKLFPVLIKHKHKNGDAASRRPADGSRRGSVQLRGGEQVRDGRRVGGGDGPPRVPEDGRGENQDGEGREEEAEGAGAEGEEK